MRVIALFLTLTPGLAVAAQDDEPIPLPAKPEAPTDAGAWLAATWAAIGPTEALEALGVVRFSGHVQALNADFQGPFEEHVHPDGRALQRIEFGESDPVFFGVDGRVSWEAWSDVGIAKFDWHAAADLRRFALHRNGATPGRPRPWASLYSEVNLGGRAVVEGRPCVRIVLTPRTAPELGLAVVAERRKPDPDVLWIDEETFLPVRYEQEMLRPAEGEIRLKETFSDWQEVDGVRFPLRRKLEVPDAGLEFRIDRVEPRVVVASTFFDVPATMAATLEQNHPHAVRLPDNGWQIVDRPETHFVQLDVDCAPADEDTARSAARAELLARLGDFGVTPLSPPEARVTGRGERVAMELRVPVKQAATIPAADASRFTATLTPAGRQVAGTHRGPRARIGESALRVEYFLRDARLTPLGGIWETLASAEGNEDVILLSVSVD